MNFETLDQRTLNGGANGGGGVSGPVPACRATASVASQSVTTTLAVIVLLPLEEFDTDAMHDPVTSNSRLTIKTAGIYQVEGYAEPSTAPVGNPPVINLFKNGVLAGPDPYNLGVSAASGRTRLSAQLLLAVNDYLELQFVNASNGTLTIQRGMLSAARLGSAV